MATIFNKNFNGGVDGNSAVAEYNESSLFFYYSAANAIHGPLSVTATGAGSSIYGVPTFAAQNVTYTQIYMRFNSAPTANGVVWRAAVLGGASAYELRLEPSGAFRVRNGFTVVGSSGSGLPYDNSPIRFMIRGDASGAAGTHQIEVRAFWGANLENPDPTAYNSQALATGLTMNSATWNSERVGIIDAGFNTTIVSWDSHSMNNGDGWPSPAGATADATAPVAVAAHVSTTATFAGGSLSTVNSISLTSAGSTDAVGITSRSWVQTSGGGGTFSSTTVTAPTFTPTGTGPWVFTVTCNDAAGNTGSDSVAVPSPQTGAATPLALTGTIVAGAA